MEKRWNSKFPNESLSSQVHGYFLPVFELQKEQGKTSHEDTNFPQFIGRKKRIQEFFNAFTDDVQNFENVCAGFKTTNQCENHVHGIGQVFFFVFFLVPFFVF